MQLKSNVSEKKPACARVPPAVRGARGDGHVLLRLRRRRDAVRRAGVAGGRLALLRLLGPLKRAKASHMIDMSEISANLSIL